MNYNQVQIGGNLGKDPVLKTFDSGGKACQISVATSEKWTSKAGEEMQHTDWHNCVFRGKICDTIMRDFKKGDPIFVVGKIKYREYENAEGKKQYVTEIIAFSFQYCGGKSKQDNNEGKWQGKQPVKAMSDVNELPGYVNDGDVPDDFPI